MAANPAEALDASLPPIMPQNSANAAHASIAKAVPHYVHAEPAPDLLHHIDLVDKELHEERYHYLHGSFAYHDEGASEWITVLYCLTLFKSVFYHSCKNSCLLLELSVDAHICADQSFTWLKILISSDLKIFCSSSVSASWIIPSHSSISALFFKAELFALCRESDELRARVAVDMRAGLYSRLPVRSESSAGYGRSAQVEFAFYVALAHGRARLRILVHKDERLQLRPPKCRARQGFRCCALQALC